MSAVEKKLMEMEIAYVRLDNLPVVPIAGEMEMDNNNNNYYYYIKK